MAKHERDKATNKARPPKDIGKASKKAPIELSENDLSRVVGGVGGGTYLKLDYKE